MLEEVLEDLACERAFEGVERLVRGRYTFDLVCGGEHSDHWGVCILRGSDEIFSLQCGQYDMHRKYIPFWPAHNPCDDVLFPGDARQDQTGNEEDHQQDLEAQA